MTKQQSKKNSTNSKIDHSIINEIKTALERARHNIVQTINCEMLTAYWQIGKIIVEHVDGGTISAAYGKQFLRNLSLQLTKEIGKGFSVSNLQYMRRFYLKYQNQQTMSVNLSWSHYCELLSIENDNEHSFYEKVTINAQWSVRSLHRQIETSLYQRLLLSAGDSNKQKGRFGLL